MRVYEDDDEMNMPQHYFATLEDEELLALWPRGILLFVFFCYMPNLQLIL